MKKYLYVEKDIADEMQRLCDKPDPDLGSDEVIFDEEVEFDDGVRMAVQVIASDDPSEYPCWTQGVLFTSDGYEIGTTEVGEDFLGEYYVEDEGVEYIAVVVTETEGEQKQLGELTPGALR